MELITHPFWNVGMFDLSCTQVQVIMESVLCESGLEGGTKEELF